MRAEQDVGAIVEQPARAAFAGMAQLEQPRLNRVRDFVESPHMHPLRGVGRYNRKLHAGRPENYVDSSIHAVWIASSIFSPQRFGSSSKSSSSLTHLNRSVKRTVSGSTPGYFSERAMAISSVSVHFITASI